MGRYDNLITGVTARVTKTIVGKPKAVGRPRQQSGGMNKTESLYAFDLKARQSSGEIAWWGYESIRLRLAPNTTYTPDFLVMLNDGSLELHETKGGLIRDDAVVKFKVAREMYWMFRFRMFQKSGGEFKEIYSER